MFAVAVPFELPQVALVDDVVSATPVEAPTVVVAVALHPLLCTVTVYVPDARPVAVAAVPPPPLHAYVGLTGLVIVTVALPLFCPQVVAAELMVSDTPVDAATEAVAVALHPLLFTVTVYVPDARPVAVAAVPPPPLHE